MRLFRVAFRSGRRISYFALGPEGLQLPAGCASTRMAAPHQFSVTNSLARFRGYAAKPSQRIGEIERCHPGIYIPGRELPALRAYCSVIDTTSPEKGTAKGDTYSPLVPKLVPAYIIVTFLRSESASEGGEVG